MAKSGDGRRVMMVERQVQETIARCVVRDFKEELPGMVTVSRVRMTADLRAAKVYITVFAQDGDEARLRKEAVKTLQGFAADIQAEIDHELKLRYCPKLQFFEDDSIGQVLHVEGVLHDLQKNRVGKKEDEGRDE